VATAALKPARAPTTAAAGATVGGGAYRILRTRELDPYDPQMTDAQIPAIGALAAAVSGDNFQGTARKAAKLSFAGAATENFPDVQTLIASLPEEQKMINHSPLITTDANSDRVAEEKRNVHLRAFIYAASREADNDFHLIVGRDPSLSPPMYMTMELSGLPPHSSASFGQLNTARDAYKAFFSDGLPGPSYDFYDPPVPIDVEGSLFFDMTHAHGGRPGPASLRNDMPVIWEVHPIRKIVFEP